MARYFKHARLLQQDNEGHCTTSAASRCTINAVRDFLEGIAMPAEPNFDKGEWPMCEADERPWQPIETAVLHADDVAMVKAWQQIGQWRSGMSAA
jgi:hypothetical protein